MVALGLVLFALAALVTGGIVFSDAGSVQVSALGMTLPTLPLGVFFVAGILTGLLGLLGLGLLSRGAARRRVLRRESRAAQRGSAELKAENERLRAELERSRSGAVADPYPTEVAASRPRAATRGR